MSKNNKHNDNQYSFHGDVEGTYADVTYLSGITNMDELAVCSDEDLYERLDDAIARRERAVYDRLNCFQWEVEIAYLQREAGIRHVRRTAHELYMQKQARLELNEQRALAEYEKNAAGFNDFDIVTKNFMVRN